VALYGIGTTQDITERKQAETRLRVSEEKFRVIFEGTLDGVLLADAKSRRIATGNPAICRMLGYSPEELTRLGVADIHPQQDLPHVIEQFEGQLRGEIQLAADLPVKRKDGSVFYADIKSSSVNFGDKTYLVGVFRDITQRKENEAKIKRLNRIYCVLSNINTTIVRVREQGELFREACRIAVEHGGFVFAWIGKFDADTRQVTPLAQAGRDDGYLAQINLTAYEGIPGSCALTTLALTGVAPVVCNDIASDERMAAWRDPALSRGYRSVSVFPLVVEGLPVGVFALYAAEPDAFDDEEMKLLIEMSEDISYALVNFRLDARRKQAEDELRKLSLAVEQSPSSIVITDLDANIEYVNEGFIRATGYRRDELIGQNPGILHSGKNSRETYDDMWAALTSGKIWKGEFINRRKDGSEYIESIFVSPVRDTEGRITHYLGIKEDITERKLAEAALSKLNEELESKVVSRTADLEHARFEAEQANQAKSSFLAAMSHEIRTPMNGVIGMLDVLQQSSLKTAQIDMVNIIHDSAFSLLSIIDEILDFSKIEAGKLQMESVPVNIADVVNGTCETMGRMALKKEVELTLFVDPAIHVAVMGDPGRLRQILVNLTSNAIKFSSGQNRQGKVSVRVLLVEDDQSENTPEQAWLEPG
ncbi:MAG: PAS domain S-box protein, partial [Gallionella sp.]